MTPRATPKELVNKALAFEESEVVPYDVRIDELVQPALLAYLGEQGRQLPVLSHLPFYPLEPERRWVTQDRYEDAFGCVWKAGNIPHIEGCRLASPSLRGYHWPDLANERCFDSTAEFIHTHQDFVTFCADAHGFYDRAWALRGMENLMIDLVLNPSFVHDLFEALTERHLGVVDRIAALGFEGIRFADDWGYQRGLLMGAERWRQFVRPGLERIFERARAKGLIVLVHSCGDVSEIIPDLIDMGVQILNPLQPEAMNVLEVKRRYGRHLCLNGGISTQLTLPHGSVDEVRREVAACLRYLGDHGGYVIGPAKPIMQGVPPANAAALIDAILDQPSAQERGAVGPLPDRVEALWRVYESFHG
ncbi:MAG: uroporphyrinogen decarboxylase family protein [Anaerolineae bacterium]